MPPTKEEVLAALETYGPSSVTSDGTTVVNRSVEEINKAVDQLATTPRVLGNPFKRVVRLKSDGAISRD